MKELKALTYSIAFILYFVATLSGIYILALMVYFGEYNIAKLGSVIHESRDVFKENLALAYGIPVLLIFEKAFRIYNRIANEK